jgi:carbon-monoxide dehydrogenase large subunit
MQRWTGASVPRVEDPRVLTGRGTYVDDLLPEGTVHVAFVRSPWPHATLLDVDCREARTMPGVVAVWSAADLGDSIAVRRGVGPEGLAVPDVEPMCTDRVRFAGDLVAMVVATSRALAEDAAERVVADYEPLDAVVVLDDALDENLPPIFASLDSNVLYDQTFRHGDPELHFAGAPRVVRRSLRQSRQANLPLEGRAVLASWHAGHLTVHAAFQNPFALRAAYAQLLGLDESQITVRCGDIGGSFGQKAYAMREEVLVAHAARALGRPVKWIEDRSENLLAAGHARDETLHVAAAVEPDGRIRAVHVQMTVDVGAYPLGTLPASIFPTLVRVLFPGPYAIDHLRFDARVCASNKASYVAYRGPWEAETFARERLLDAIAHDLGLDPVEVRLVNLVPPTGFPRTMVTGPTQEHVLILDTMERAFERLDIDATRAACAAARAEGVLRGVGFSVVLEPAPGPQNYAIALGAAASPRSAQSAWAVLTGEGRVRVHTSQIPHGQSHHTTLAQLAADRLGVHYAEVEVVSGDTDTTPFNLVGTGGSRAATLASGAVLGAANALRAEIIDTAAALLEAAPADLDLLDNSAVVRGTPSRAVSFGEVVARRGEVRVEFEYAIPPGGWTQATHACVVDVDADTGQVTVLRYVVAEDCGKLVNPRVVDGQIRGGVAQGIAGVLLEHVAFADDGQPLTTTLMDYLPPLATDLPTIEIEHLEQTSHGEHEYRGVGEGGAIGAPAALVAAIENALSRHDVQIGDQYLPPWRILELIGKQAP